MTMPDWTPSFTLNELYEISDAVMPVLRCYLEDGDPEQHEQRYRSVSTLLEIVRKLNISFGISSGMRRGNELPEWFPQLELERYKIWSENAPTMAFLRPRMRPLNLASIYSGRHMPPVNRQSKTVTDTCSSKLC